MSSLIVAATGIIIVFISLVLIATAITIFGGVINIRKNKNISSEPKPDVPDNNCSVQTQEDTSDREIVAVIAAALQAAFSSREINTPLKIHSFRRISGETPTWKSASWHEQLRDTQSEHK